MASYIVEADSLVAFIMFTGPSLLRVQYLLPATVGGFFGSSNDGTVLVFVVGRGGKSFMQ